MKEPSSRTRARNLCSHYATTEIHYERHALSRFGDRSAKDDLDEERLRCIKGNRRERAPSLDDALRESYSEVFYGRNCVY